MDNMTIQWHKSTCPYCGFGCGLMVGVEQGEVVENDEVEVALRRGCVRLPARLADHLLAGTLFIPWHYGPELGVGDGKLANLVTHSVYDSHSKQPEYKFSAVKVLTPSTVQET